MQYLKFSSEAIYLVYDMDSSSLEQTSEFYSPLKVNKISELCVFLTLKSKQNIHTQCFFHP